MSELRRDGRSVATRRRTGPIVPAGARVALARMMTDRLGRTSIRSLQVLTVVLLAALAVFALVQVRLLMIPVLIAIILAAAAAPVVGRLRARGAPPMLAAWVVLVGALLVLGGAITGIVFAVRSQWDELVTSATEGYGELRDWLTTLPLPIDEARLDELGDQIADFVTSAQFGSGALAGVSTAVEIVTGALLMIVILFFFLKDGDRIWAFLLKPFSAEGRARGERVGQTGVRTLGGYARGTALIAAVDAIGIGIALLILQVPLAIPLAALVFLGAFVPIVGATVTGVLAALVALVTNGLPAAIIVGIVIIVINQLEGNFLQPVVMSQSVRLHPLVILGALTIGTVLGGIAGAVLAVPIAAVAWAAIKAWDVHNPDVEEAPARR